MAQLEFVMPAAEGEAYAPGCLDGFVGRQITVNLVPPQPRGGYSIEPGS